MRFSAIFIVTAAAALVLGPATVSADNFVYPTYPGTSFRDYSQPGYGVEQDYGGAQNVYPTYPGTNFRDYQQPGYRVEQGYGGQQNVYPTYPGTNFRDHSKPGYVIQGR